MDKIILNKDYPCDLIRVLACLCLNVQREFDMSPQLLNYIINLRTFTTWSLFLYEQSYAEMNASLNKFKDSFHPDENQIRRDEFDKCGHLITSHHNTFISYCNAHRYLHPHPNLPDHSGRLDIKHPFVTKNYNQIVEEKYKSTIHEIYQTFINKLYHMTRQTFIYIIDTHFKSSTILVASQEANAVIEQMKQDPTIFKSRCVYEHLEPLVEQQEPKKNYYIKVYHR